MKLSDGEVLYLLKGSVESLYKTTEITYTKGVQFGGIHPAQLNALERDVKLVQRWLKAAKARTNSKT